MTPRRSTRPPIRPLVSFLRRLAFPAIALLFLGAAPPSASAGVVGYLRDRGEDFLDVFRIRYIVPYRAEGYGAKARVTSLAQVGYVHLKGDAYGMDRRAIGHNEEKRTEGGVSVAYFSRTEMKKAGGNQYLDVDTPWSQAAPRGIMRQGGAWDDGRLHPVSIGAEVELGLFGVDLGVYPTEAIDFATGLLTFDIYKDDRSYTDDLPEFDLEAKEKKAQEEEAARKKALEESKTHAADKTTTPGAMPGMIPAETTLLPQGPDEEMPAAEGTQPSDSTLQSEFVTPKDIQELKSREAAPEMKTVETPLPSESKETEAPESAPAAPPSAPDAAPDAAPAPPAAPPSAPPPPAAPPSAPPSAPAKPPANQPSQGGPTP